MKYMSQASGPARSPIQNLAKVELAQANHHPSPFHGKIQSVMNPSAGQAESGCQREFR